MDIFEYTSGAAELSEMCVVGTIGLGIGIATSATSSENPEDMPLALTLTGISAVGATSEESSSGDSPDGFIVWFRKDAVPYSAVEKRADKIYRRFHGNESNQKFPCIIVESPKIADELDEILEKSPEYKSSAYKEDVLAALQQAYREYIHE